MYSKKNLIARIDCCIDRDADSFCANGSTSIVHSPIGSYREAAAEPLARFVYRFGVENIGRPHLALVRYPDDKRRFMLIGDGTSYDLSTGVITGHAFPVSGKMQELNQVFWPRWKDCTLGFTTWGYGEPAAAASIEIYELEELPPLDIPNHPGNRELGIQYEDCCGTGASEGARTFSEWLDRVITYAKHTGQNLLSYPIAWYHGPIFPSRTERGDVFSIVVAEDRRQYIAWTDDPPDWPATLLERFEQEGLEFQGVLTLLRLSSLMRKFDPDLERILSGGDTLHNMLWNDHVQAGTMDWTTVYNTLNFPAILDRPDPISLKPDFAWAYGESTEHTYRENAPYRPGPIFNPLHPEVQDAVREFFHEIAERYGRFSSFKGVAVTMWAPTMLWFGSLHSGYDDVTIRLFEKETGIEVPVDPLDRQRFSKRYQYLTFQCRQAWIDWRCRKIRDFICELRDTLVSVRPDLRLTLNLWSEPYVPAVLGAGRAEHQIYARPGTHQLYKEAGLDMRLFEREANIEFDLQTEGGGRDRSPSNQPGSKLEQFFMFRDHDFLDEETNTALRSQAQPGVFIFNAWHEAWGKHLWFANDAADPNLPDIAETYGQRSGKSFRINSVYAKDGFWWDSELRISPAFPPAPHFLEQYAHALAEYDATRITRGGLFLDKAHAEEVRRFASAYRALPRVRFATVGQSTDPVAVRTAVHEGRRYIYLVNREWYPIQVTLVLQGKIEPVLDLAKEQELPASDALVIDLGGYGLRALATSPSVDVVDSSVVPPVDIVESLTSHASIVQERILELQAGGRHLAGLSTISTRIADAVNHRHYALLRRLLTSYPARKAMELEASATSLNSASIPA